MWARGLADGALRDGGFLGEADQALGRLAPYVATALVSDTETASTWFDELARLYQELLTSGAIGSTRRPASAGTTSTTPT